MHILEHRDQWYAADRDGWLAYYQQTGQFDWKRYVRVSRQLWRRDI